MTSALRAVGWGAFVTALLLNVACCQQAVRPKPPPKPTRHPLDFPPPQVPADSVPAVEDPLKPYDNWQAVGPDDIVFGTPIAHIETFPVFNSFDFSAVDACTP